jgi:predicted O-methyltransferase YrrM
MALIRPEWNQAFRELEKETAARRPPKNTKTGSVSRAACAYLAAVTELLRPSIIVEVGTFVGTSILAMRATKHKYTCDKDNALLPSMEGLTVYPRTTSTEMFRDLVQEGIIADFMFFDGRAQDDDFPLIEQLSQSGTVYGFDDFEPGGKGMWNIRRFVHWFPDHRLVEPPMYVPHVKGETTIALLIPKQLE